MIACVLKFLNHYKNVPQIRFAFFPKKKIYYANFFPQNKIDIVLKDIHMYIRNYIF